MIIVASNRAVAKLIKHSVLALSAASHEFAFAAALCVSINIDAVIVLDRNDTTLLQLTLISEMIWCAIRIAEFVAAAIVGFFWRFCGAILIDVVFYEFAPCRAAIPWRLT